MPQAFVTGATGFVGQHLVQQLVEAGWDVTVFRRRGSKPGILDNLPVEHRFGDLTDPVTVREAVDAPYDALFHVAADTSPWRGDADHQRAVNVTGTGNVIDAATGAGVGRFIHTSSIMVWGFPRELPIRETTTRDENARWIGYCETKAESEELVRTADIDAVILNPSHIMGPLDRRNWIRMIRMVVAGKLPGTPPGAGSFADVRDVARAHIAAHDKGRTNRNYLLGGENHSFEDVIRAIGELSGKPVRRPVLPAVLVRAVGTAGNMIGRLTGRRPDLTPEGAAIICGSTICDSTRAVRELDYRITPLRQILKDTLAWMKEEGMS